jgi:hypothetical protein
VIFIVGLLLAVAIFFMVKEIRDCDRIGGVWVGGITQMAYCALPKNSADAGQMAR